MVEDRVFGKAARLDGGVTGKARQWKKRESSRREVSDKIMVLFIMYFWFYNIDQR